MKGAIRRFVQPDEGEGLFVYTQEVYKWKYSRWSDFRIYDISSGEPVLVHEAGTYHEVLRRVGASERVVSVDTSSATDLIMFLIGV
ncbi:MAG: hypothetical protein O3B64_00890 [bacterium]|nr:hypothetical protein [bacterium]